MTLQHHHNSPTQSSICAAFAEFEAADREALKSVFSAVTGELGVRPAVQAKHEAIASELADHWRRGRRMPLNLVSAGLEAGGA